MSLSVLCESKMVPLNFLIWYIGFTNEGPCANLEDKEGGVIKNTLITSTKNSKSGTILDQI